MVKNNIFFFKKYSYVPFWAKQKLKIKRASNHMFGRAIWHKLPQYIFESFEIALFLKKFENHEGNLYQKLPQPNMRLLFNHTKPSNTLYWN